MKAIVQQNEEIPIHTAAAQPLMAETKTRILRSRAKEHAVYQNIDTLIEKMGLDVTQGERQSLRAALYHWSTFEVANGWTLLERAAER